MKYAIYWDNGAHDCGTFRDRYDTEDEAQAVADAWVKERNAEDGLDPDSEDSYSAEVIEVDE